MTCPFSVTEFNPVPVRDGVGGENLDTTQHHPWKKNKFKNYVKK